MDLRRMAPFGTDADLEIVPTYSYIKKVMNGAEILIALSLEGNSTRSMLFTW
jgi:hypothetical protein